MHFLKSDVRCVDLDSASQKNPPNALVWCEQKCLQQAPASSFGGLRVAGTKTVCCSSVSRQYKYFIFKFVTLLITL